MDAENLFKIVIVGHVDHGKSTIIGRLLSDTGSLPNGKLEQVKEMCRKNSRPFEYAFLLDALKNEQRQGITIDMARCFFKTEKRKYLIIDAPGHIEFLKNMVTGAARADAALLVIDAKEGIMENSKRHGYMMSMLGIRQIAVIVNKFDLVDYSREVYEQIKSEYSSFLESIGITATNFIPASGRGGDNIIDKSPNIPWFEGPSILGQLDSFKQKPGSADRPFRMPVQDIYKFTDFNDDRRIIAGTVETGKVKVGDRVIFLPSGKESEISSIEGFNSPRKDEIGSPFSTGFTTSTQIYVKPGELMCRKDENPPQVSSRLKVNIFWMSKAPMITGKRYKLKLASARESVELVDVLNVIDASELSTIEGKKQLDRHDVGECIIETSKPVAFDPVGEIENTGRFVIVDNYEIAGGGIIISKADSEDSLIRHHVIEREYTWEKGMINEGDRVSRNSHKSKFVIITGEAGDEKRILAKKLEYQLFMLRLDAYYLGVGSIFSGLDSDMAGFSDRNEHVRRIGELARIMTDAGLIFITAIDDLDEYDVEKLRLLNSPNEALVVSFGGEATLSGKADLNLLSNHPLEESLNSIMNVLYESGVIYKR